MLSPLILKDKVPHLISFNNQIWQYVWEHVGWLIHDYLINEEIIDHLEDEFYA